MPTNERAPFMSRSPLWLVGGSSGFSGKQSAAQHDMTRCGASDTDGNDQEIGAVKNQLQAGLHVPRKRQWRGKRRDPHDVDEKADSHEVENPGEPFAGRKRTYNEREHAADDVEVLPGPGH